jgi:hypothetical protein
MSVDEVKQLKEKFPESTKLEPLLKQLKEAGEGYKQATAQVQGVFEEEVKAEKEKEEKKKAEEALTKAEELAKEKGVKADEK